MTSPRHLAAALVAGAALASPSLAAAGVASATAPPLSVAVVVGSNHSPSSTQQDLRYGDDDAVQNARTMAMLGVDTMLLVSPDAETRELFPSTKPQGPATQAALHVAFDAAKARIAAAHAQGRHTELYFLFAGHGDTADGRPFLQLDDGKLWREDLAELLRAASADENHMLVDACYAAAFVSDRGPGGQREGLPAGFSRARAVWPARTGFLTARSSGGQTHEWAEYQSGVFSHELRSGLVGAADVNLDGKVTYREIAAFVRRANEAIPNHRYRPEVSTVAPGGDLDAALAVLPAGPIVLEMDVQPAGRAFVESETGIRLVDLHPAAGVNVQVRLPTDLGSLFVEQEATPNVSSSLREFRLQPRAGHVRMSTLAANTPHVSARGAGHEAFLHLFALPFDGDAAAAFSLDAQDAAELKWQQDYDKAEHQKTLRRRFGIGALSLGVATAAIGSGLWWSGHQIYEQYKSTNNPLPPGAQTRIDDRYDARNVFYGVAGASLITGAVLMLWPDAPALSVAATPSGETSLAYTGRF
jgi:hypothetical protein